MSGLTLNPAGPLHIPSLGSVWFAETGLDETYEILQYSHPREAAITTNNIMGLFVRANQTGPEPVILPSLSTFEIKPRTGISPGDGRGNWTLIAGEIFRPVHGEILEDYLQSTQNGLFPTSGGLVVEADMAFSSKDSTMAILSKIQFHVQRAVSMNAYPLTFRIWPKMLENIVPKMREMADRGWIYWNPVSLQGSIERNFEFSNLLKGSFSFVVYADLEGGFRNTKRPLNDQEQKTLTELWKEA